MFLIILGIILIIGSLLFRIWAINTTKEDGYTSKSFKIQVKGDVKKYSWWVITLGMVFIIIGLL